MKILMFCPQFAPLIGGAERQAERLAKGLIAERTRVEVWTPLLDRSSPRHETRDGLPVNRFPLSDLSKRWPGMPGIGLLNAPWIVLQLFWRLWRPIGEVDLVHCHIGSLQTIAVAWVARARGVPVICKAAMADQESDLGEMKGVTGRLFARLGRNAFTRWIATTDAVRQALLRAGVNEKRIIVIPNGVETSENTYRRTPRPVRRFLYLGRLSSNIQRDVPTLVAAFDRVAAQVPDAQLALVGGGDLLEATRELVRSCAHAERIQVPGFGDAAEWLKWADCFVLPSRREGLSNALLEAMACGLPCIANDIPPNREVLGGDESGMLVPVGNILALEQAMLRLVGSHDLAARLSRSALKRITSNYSLSSVSRGYECLYSSLLSDP